MNINEMVAAEMEAYSEGAYADHGSARDMLTRFANAVLSAGREDFIGWLQNERMKCGAVDGYGYESGVEYGLRKAEAELAKRPND